MSTANCFPFVVCVWCRIWCGERARGCPVPAGQGRDDLVVTGVITASEPSWIGPFAGLSPRQFSRLITALRRREGADPVRKGRPWSLPWGGVLLVAAYWRTNLTLCQLAPL